MSWRFWVDKEGYTLWEALLHTLLRSALLLAVLGGALAAAAWVLS